MSLSRWLPRLTWLALAGYGMAQDAGAVKFGTTVVIPAGLRGIVYHIPPGTTRLPNFAKLKPQGTIYTSSLNVPPQNFQDGFPGVTRRFEWFAIDYTGRFWIETPSEYRFSLSSDDGADLWIDDQLVIDNDGQHPAVEAAGGVALSRGVHRIRVAYFQGPRFEVALILKIAPQGQDFRAFNTDDFKPPPDASIDSESANDQIRIDNDFVRVIQAIIPPHEKSPLQEHPLNRVIVYLDKGKLDVRDQDGHEQKRNFSTGQAVWSAAAEQHSNENTGSAPIRVIEIELKKPAPVTPAPRAKELDPVAIDPKHNILLFENDQVRVFRSWREPGAEERLHEHTGAGRVAVFLTDIDAAVHSEGSETPLHASSGEVTWSGPATHSALNTGTRKFEMIVVEVK
jgi:mannose-6-phosphate isomerase-like protein (cupin superfamily)